MTENDRKFNKLSNEFIKVLNLLIEMFSRSSSKKCSEKDEHYFELANAVALKFIQSMLSIHSLFENTCSTKFKAKVNFLDMNSITILFRAAFESQIMFCYLFREDEEIRRFRMATWELGGLLQRWKIQTSIDYSEFEKDMTEFPDYLQKTIGGEVKIEDVKRKARGIYLRYWQKEKMRLLQLVAQGASKISESGCNDKDEKTYLANLYCNIGSYKKKMEKNGCFLKIRDQREKNNLLRGLWMNGKSWKRIAQEETELDRDFIRKTFAILDDYAHSGNISVVDVHAYYKLGDREDLENAKYATLLSILILLSHFIVAYKKVFPEADALYNKKKDIDLNDSFSLNSKFSNLKFTSFEDLRKINVKSRSDTDLVEQYFDFGKKFTHFMEANK